MEVTGVRLANGKGALKAPQKASSAEQCVAACHGQGNCAQVIYSAGNKGCYLFAEATYRVLGVSDLFHSAYCGKAMSGHRVRLMQQSALKVKRQHESAAVQRSWRSAETDAWATVSTLSMQAKVSLLHGGPNGGGYAGFISWGADGELSLRMNDGPQGYNPYQKQYSGTATQFPALIAVAASFSPSTARRYAAAVADEFVAKGANVVLGPDVEVMRAPLSGRAFETISGEDPYLGSELVRPYVQEVQKRGLIATVKHWLDNNQEIMRQTVNVNVSDRAQHEIYMQPFKAAFEAGAGAVMCAYNKVGGDQACESKELLTTLLRKDLGFKGYVVSDWGATHDALKAAVAGLSIEMPSDQRFRVLSKLVKEGRLPEKTVEVMAVSVLAAMHAVGQLDGRFPTWGALAKDATCDEHRAVARETIIDSAVLLKNNASTLPLATKGKTIAFVGKYCDQAHDAKYKQGSVFSGGGSGYVATHLAVTPLVGVREHIKDAARLLWSADASSGRGADVAVVCASAHAEEGWDRESLDLPEAGDLIAELRRQPGLKRIVVVAMVPGPVTTEWLQEADAALLLFMPGEQVGPAIAQLLTGSASPGGRLPVSLPRPGERRFTEEEQYPGVPATPAERHFKRFSAKWGAHLQEKFSEGVLVGYRWNDARGVPSAFPFGHGLSYTEFHFYDFKHEVNCIGEKASVSLKVANVGSRDGTAVPQLYIGFPSLAPVVRQLRAFEKVLVSADSAVDVVFLLGSEDWSFFDEGAHVWRSAMSKGEHITLSVGSSSSDLQWHQAFHCSSDES